MRAMICVMAALVGLIGLGRIEQRRQETQVIQRLTGLEAQLQSAHAQRDLIEGELDREKIRNQKLTELMNRGAVEHDAEDRAAAAHALEIHGCTRRPH